MDTLLSENQLLTGCGIGLRSPHVQELLERADNVKWLEILVDNHRPFDEMYRSHLLRLREQFPFTMHSVGVSLGGTDPLDKEYMQFLKHFADTFEVSIVSEHLCFTMAHGHHFHDLLPLPYTEEAVQHVVNRIAQLQDYLGRTIALENVSSYIDYKCSHMTEWEFLTEIAERSGCNLLLDINNVYVTACNKGLSASDFIAELPISKITQLHLAGHVEEDGILLDTHSTKIAPQVWDLYRELIASAGQLPTLIEWDNDIPSLKTLQREAEKAQQILDAYQPLKATG